MGKSGVVAVVLLSSILGGAASYRWGYQQGHTVGLEAGRGAAWTAGHDRGVRDGEFLGRQVPIDTGTTSRSGADFHLASTHVTYSLGSGNDAVACAAYALVTPGGVLWDRHADANAAHRLLVMGPDLTDALTPAVSGEPKLVVIDGIQSATCDQSKKQQLSLTLGGQKTAILNFDGSGGCTETASRLNDSKFREFRANGTPCSLGLQMMEGTKELIVTVRLPSGVAHSCQPTDKNLHDYCVRNVDCSKPASP